MNSETVKSSAVEIKDLLKLNMNTLKTTVSPFGKHEGKEIKLFTIENQNGMTVKISNYGATITSIIVPDKNGDTSEMVCGFDSFESYFSKPYLANAPYFGGTIGRYCSQIKDAKFSLNGQEYTLAKMVGNNNLHGGKKGFDKHIWRDQYFSADEAKLVLQLHSPGGEEGFPGNVSATVAFTLTDDNELKLDYSATTDADTPFTMTNHSYFNLTGFDDTIEGHEVQLFSDKRQVWDDTGAATGKNISVAGAVDDLRTGKNIGEVHRAMGDGFEHYYLFEDKGFVLDRVAVISEPKSGRRLEVSTTEPGMLFYTGKYTSNDLKRESGQQYGKYRGFCCETHRYPNGPNIYDAPKSILKKGATYNSTTVFKFKW